MILHWTLVTLLKTGNLRGFDCSPAAQKMHNFQASRKTYTPREKSGNRIQRQLTKGEIQMFHNNRRVDKRESPDFHVLKRCHIRAQKKHLRAVNAKASGRFKSERRMAETCLDAHLTPSRDWASGWMGCSPGTGTSPGRRRGRPQPEPCSWEPEPSCPPKRIATL